MHCKYHVETPFRNSIKWPEQAQIKAAAAAAAVPATWMLMCSFRPPSRPALIELLLAVPLFSSRLGFRYLRSSCVSSPPQEKNEIFPRSTKKKLAPVSDGTRQTAPPLTEVVFPVFVSTPRHDKPAAVPTWPTVPSSGWRKWPPAVTWGNPRKMRSSQIISDWSCGKMSFTEGLRPAPSNFP